LIGAPIVVPKLSAPKFCITLPSSTMSPYNVCVPLTVIEYVPVALVPAANAATPPGTQGAGSPVPSEFAFQSEIDEFQMPVGFTPPAPARSNVSMSQYLVCAATCVALVMSNDRAISDRRDRIVVRLRRKK